MCSWLFGWYYVNARNRMLTKKKRLIHVHRPYCPCLWTCLSAIQYTTVYLVYAISALFWGAKPLLYIKSQCIKWVWSSLNTAVFGIYTECGRKTWQFLSLVILAIMLGRVTHPRSVASWFHAISVAMEQRIARHCVFDLLKLISRMAIQQLQDNDYFADTLTFVVMAVFPVVTS